MRRALAIETPGINPTNTVRTLGPAEAVLTSRSTPAPRLVTGMIGRSDSSRIWRPVTACTWSSAILTPSPTSKSGGPAVVGARPVAISR